MNREKLHHVNPLQIIVKGSQICEHIRVVRQQAQELSNKLKTLWPGALLEAIFNSVDLILLATAHLKPQSQADLDHSLFLS